MTSRTSRVIKGGITGLLQQFLAILLQLASAPLILSYAGQNTLGAYVIVMQIIGYGILMDFGFSVALTRHLSQAHNPNVAGDRFREILTVGRNVLFITNLLTATMLVAAAWNIDFFISEEPVIESDAQTALYIMAVWSVVRTPLYVYGFALTATQELANLNIIGVVANLLRLVTTLAFVYQGWGLVGLVSATILSELLGGIIQFFLFRRHYRRYQARMEIGSIKVGQDMVRFGLRYWGVNLSVILLLGSDNLIAGSLYGAAVASIFYTTKMFGSLLIVFISRIIDYISPGINQLIGEGDLNSVKRVYLDMLRYLLLITLPAIIGSIIFLRGLVTLWVGPEQFGGQLMAYGVALLVLIQTLCHLNGITVLALGKITYWPTLSIGCGALALLGGYWLGKWYGMAWIIISLALAMLPLLGFLTLRTIRQLDIAVWELLNASKPALFAMIPLVIFAHAAVQINFSITLINISQILSIYLLLCLGATWYIGLYKSERQKFSGAIKLYLK
jgi:O-antigen/teichoic acid export membrane protein